MENGSAAEVFAARARRTRTSRRPLEYDPDGSSRAADADRDRALAADPGSTRRPAARSIPAGRSAFSRRRRGRGAPSTAGRRCRRTRRRLPASPSVAAAAAARRCEPRRQPMSHRATLGGEAPLVELDHVTKHFAVRQGVFASGKSVVHAVEDVSLAIRPGETLGIVGESGSRQVAPTARIVRCWSGPRRHQRLRLRFGDVLDVVARVELAGPRSVRRRLGIVFQDPYLTRSTARFTLRRIYRRAVAARARLAHAPARRSRSCWTSVGMENAA